MAFNQKEYNRKYYQRHREQRKAYSKIYDEAHKNQKKIYQQYKKLSWLAFMRRMGLPMPDRKLIHYHHINPITKKFDVGYWLGRYPYNKRNIKILLAEINKCVCLSIGLHNRFHNNHNFRNYFTAYANILEKKISKG